MAVGKDQRFSAHDPCPICGGHQQGRGGNRCYGYYSADRRSAHCTVDTGADQVPYNPNDSTYSHALAGTCACGAQHTDAPEPASVPRAARQPAQIDMVYDYCDAEGLSRFQTVRFVPKDFRQRHMGKDGKWIWNLEGVNVTLYRLPELLAAPHATVFVVEGEKDVETMRAHGFTATCNPMGAGKWRDEYSQTLKGRHVVIIPDNDPERDERGKSHRKGQKHAAAVAKALHGVAASVKIVTLPASHGKDVTDYFSNGGTVDGLRSLVALAPEYAPPEPEQPRAPLTELGNAQRLVARCGGDLRYCFTWKVWLIWTGSHWQEDATGEITRRAKATVKAIYAEAAQADDKDEAREIAKHALRSQSAKAIKAMIELAQSELPIAPDDLDADPWLFNCANGTLDLHTGQLRPHRREDFLTKISPVPYDAKATHPAWDAYLASSMNGNAALMTFLQRAAGYSLTGDISEEVFFFLHGPENAGKSTFLEAMKATLGTYAHAAQFESFMQRQNQNGPRDDIAAMIGARFVSASEGDRGQKLAHALVKQITGGDHVRARRLYSASFEFRPTFKLWLAANDAPRVHDDDAAMWRRILKVPFEHPPVKKDPSIKAALINPEIGGPAILAWLVAGCLDWQRDGLAIPDEVRVATQTYRQDMDPLKDFLETRCIAEDEAQIPADALYLAYQEYCKESGIRNAFSRRAFGDRIVKHGYLNATIRFNARVMRGWLGLRLVTEEDDVTQSKNPLRYASEASSGLASQGPKQAVTQSDSNTLPYIPSRVETLQKDTPLRYNVTPPANSCALAGEEHCEILGVERDGNGNLLCAYHATQRKKRLTALRAQKDCVTPERTVS